MSRDYIPLYDGALQANRVASFTRAGLTIDVIRPGYDIQGRRRQAWTQFVVDGVPVFEVKLRTTLDAAMAKFDELWLRYFEPQAEPMVQSALTKALENCRNDHISKFRDGVSGESPAPSLAHDGRPDGKQYPA